MYSAEGIRIALTHSRKSRPSMIKDKIDNFCVAIKFFSVFESWHRLDRRYVLRMWDRIDSQISGYNKWNLIIIPMFIKVSMTLTFHWYWCFPRKVPRTDSKFCLPLVFACMSHIIISFLRSVTWRLSLSISFTDI